MPYLDDLKELILLYVSSVAHIIHVEGPLQALLHGAFQVDSQHGQDIAEPHPSLLIHFKLVEHMVSKLACVSIGEPLTVQVLCTW